MPPHEDIVTKYVEKLGAELGQIQAHIWSECVQLHVDLSELRYLFSKAEDIDLLNAAAPSFFRLLQDLLVEEILLGLCRLTDPSSNRHQKNLSLKGAIAAIKSSPNAQPAANLEAKVLAFEASLDFARKHRDKRYAHTDLEARLNPRIVPPLPPVTYENIVNAVERLGALVNEMDMQLGMVQTHWDIDDPSSRRLKMLVKRGFDQEKLDNQDRISGLVRIPIDASFLYMAMSRSNGDEEMARRWLQDAVEEKLKLLSDQ